jgi:2-keto-4-pentenoate hydratase/2-oxohepta-3-ene-1,7-dioic acid hydratase in catechol pathway
MWKIDELISYVSQFFAENRRYYFTGTPAGVAAVKPDILEVLGDKTI